MGTPIRRNSSGKSSQPASTVSRAALYGAVAKQAGREVDRQTLLPWRATGPPRYARILLGLLCFLALAGAAHAESWMLWQQAAVFTERWWVPKGWAIHWKATEMTPVGLSEFQTLGECQLAEAQAMSPDAHRAREAEAKEKSGMTTTRSVSRFACVPGGWRPWRIEPGGVWK
jgi:hypothetical protein